MKLSNINLFWVILILTGCSNNNTFIRITYPEGNVKSLLMSYDDGTIEDIELAKLFNDNKIIGTFNLNSEYLGMIRGWPLQNGDTVYQEYISKDLLYDVYKNHEISAHGAFHKGLTSLTDDEILIEIESDILNLQKLTNRQIKSMAYAFGNTNEHIAKLIVGTGLTNARTINDTYKFDLPNDNFIWNPTCHDSRALDYLNEYLLLESPKLTVFYVWGHSWEFKDQTRWTGITEFCEQIGSRNDIWYAGTGTFIDYLNAIKKLEITQSKIFNPKENLPIWIELSSGIQILNPGQKIKLAAKEI
ncbi:MAG: hypothetical protein DRI75_07670 [Bacteroidetes bacterium]|nr:MAG: hypothetical protein DRI75_07670 [Bacteroidota bacterium]